MTWEREVIALHQFFQRWYHGTCEPGDLATLEAALAEDFTMVLPGGRIVRRAGVIEGIAGGYGRDPHIRIAVDGFETLVQHMDFVIGRYEEHQQTHDSPPSHRVSTVVFRRRAGSGALRWLTVHETWAAPGGPPGSVS